MLLSYHNSCFLGTGILDLYSVYRMLIQFCLLLLIHIHFLNWINKGSTNPRCVLLRLVREILALLLLSDDQREERVISRNTVALWKRRPGGRSGRKRITWTVAKCFCVWGWGGWGGQKCIHFVHLTLALSINIPRVFIHDENHHRYMRRKDFWGGGEEGRPFSQYHVKLLFLAKIASCGLAREHNVRG